MPHADTSTAVAFRSQTRLPTLQLAKVLRPADYAAAMDMARQGRYHRKMVFGRRHGHWVINGQTWTSFQIAAKVGACHL